MPFMEADRLGKLSARTTRFTYAPVIKYFRDRNMRTRFEVEPEWRRPTDQLETGYRGRW
jgi:hypothetical protein